MKPSSSEVSLWTTSRFPPHLYKEASYVAELLPDMLGISLGEIEPDSRFTEDLRADELEPVEIVMAIGEDLNISISDKEATQLSTVYDLIQFLYTHAENKSA